MWFSLGKYNHLCFLTLCVLCLISFLPFKAGFVISGMDLFGWAQGLLMLIAPVVTLFFVHMGRKEKGEKR